MIKKISVDQLKPDMYVSDLNCDWIPHHNFQKEGRIPDQSIIDEIRRRGIHEVYIDTARGLDAGDDALTATEVDRNNQAALDKAAALKPDHKARNGVQEELLKANKIHTQAKGLVSNVLKDVKLGRAIDVEAFDRLADGMVDSVLRNHNALACLGRIREKDNYLLEHSINLAVLMGIFAKSMKIDRETMHQTIVGAMLHDIGKVMIPDEVLHKPGKLSDDEFAIMRNHVVFSRELLKKTPGVSELTIKVAAQHHERIDGSGYPEGLHDCDICREGKMCAIADVYDAITADRVYHKGLPPTMALKKLLEWSGTHLDQTLVHRFIRSMGIYPVGSLVKLKSQRLAVVIEASESDQRLPLVKVIYSTSSQRYLPVEIIDLSKPTTQDEILQAVDPARFGIRLNDFIA
ncbi:HD-GYP domain-containing protein [Thalassolituus pacificus]|uniref:HD-GYP domain-containing protein n=1 Tax=Thalassolituus pacificus TaxID=2975440 RepID=A0A9X2WEN5_9GAMM|nr:HD-GYP domain-containing protein [Thalassolituus pacificus]MCT7358751.1 HD-GYP domain-containing protein [Thalassolituus pacificus]